VAPVGRRQGQEDEGRAVGQVHGGGGGVALAAERVDPAPVDVDEVDRVPGGGEALAGRASHDAGADDDDI
jgi:hypothetical protein